MALQQQKGLQQVCTAGRSSSSPSSAPNSKPKIESIIPLFDLVRGHDPYDDMPQQLTAALQDYFVAAADKVKQSDCECCSCCGCDAEGRAPLLLPAFYRSLQAELLQGVAVLGPSAECSADVQGKLQMAVVAVLAGITKASHNDDVAKQLLLYIGQQELGNAARVAAHAGCARIIGKQRVLQQLGKPLEHCCNEHLAALLPIFKDTLKEVQKAMGSSTTGNVAAAAEQAMIWSTAVALLRAPGVATADAAAAAAESTTAIAAADNAPASKALTVPAEAAAATSSSSNGSWGAFSGLAGLFRGITSRKVSSAATTGDPAAAQATGSSGRGTAQRSSIYASAAAAAATASVDEALQLVHGDAVSEEDPFDQEVRRKFWSAANAEHPETMVGCGCSTVGSGVHQEYHVSGVHLLNAACLRQGSMRPCSSCCRFADACF
jgi:hypothetical protein